MKVEIVEQWTMKNPLECIGFFPAVCYGTKTDDIERNVKRGLQCIADGHGRVEELPDVYLILDGWSAKCLRELYTHIGGMPTRMQASTRYIDYAKGDKFKAVTPPLVNKNEQAATIWQDAIEYISDAMNKLKDLGIPKEDYTNLLPLAYESKMIWKVNLRCLINFMNMRLCSRAYWEIRKLASEIKAALSNYSDQWKTIADMLFVPKCEVYGFCVEHETCGRKKSKEDFLNTK